MEYILSYEVPTACTMHVTINSKFVSLLLLQYVVSLKTVHSSVFIIVL